MSRARSGPIWRRRRRPPSPHGAGVADEVATAATDVAGEVLGVDVVRAPAGSPDDLRKLKGVGPKFVARLNELGIVRFDQLAGLNANEAAHLDERMGPFQGRLAKDRVIEQADLLARGDIETTSRRSSGNWADKEKEGLSTSFSSFQRKLDDPHFVLPVVRKGKDDFQLSLE